MKPFTKQILLFGGSNLDADAEAFLQAAGITDTIIISAINAFVLDLKANNLWSLFVAIHPIVGGTAFSHQFNLKDPRDLNAAYRLTFFGGLTHDSNGITGNAVNGYANTHLLANALSLNNLSLSVYSRTDGNNTGAEIGTFAATPTLKLLLRYTNNATYFDLNNASNATGYTEALSKTGLFTACRTANNVLNLYRRGASIKSNTNISTTQNANDIEYMRINGGSYSGRNTCFYSIGQGLTNTQCSQLNSAVQQLQVSLSRNIY